MLHQSAVECSNFEEKEVLKSNQNQIDGTLKIRIFV